MISLSNITLQRGREKLLVDTSVVIVGGRHLALIGRNGCGKSSLFSLLQGHIGAEAGDLSIPSNSRVSHMAQEVAQVSNLETEEEKQLYAIGLSVAGNTLGTFKGEFNEDEVALIAAGFADGMLETEAKVDMEEYGPKLNAYLQQRFQNVHLESVSM